MSSRLRFGSNLFKPKLPTRRLRMPRLQKKLPLRRLPTKKLPGRAPCRFRRYAPQIRSAIRTWKLGLPLSLTKSLHTAATMTFEEGSCRSNSKTY